MVEVSFKKKISWRVRKISNTYLLMNGVEAYEINEVGVSVWDQIDGEKTVSEIIQLLKGEYDTNTEILTRDIVRFMTEMENNDIVIRTI